MFSDGNLTYKEFSYLIDTLGGPRYEDLRFPSQAINPPGIASDPDLETTTGLWLFAAAATETLAGIAQLPHAWKEGSAINPHVHWQKTTSAAGNVLWQLEYEVVNNGGIAAMDYGTVLSSAEIVSGLSDDNTANQILITSLGDLDMDGMKISSIIFWKLSRVGGHATDTYGADARLIELDFHYIVDTRGSVQEFVKQ